ncbi:MAG: acyl-protein synthetase [Clostridiales bacterium]|nr:acyl-protein synthetase [Clostridiales bacterium]
MIDDMFEIPPFSLDRAAKAALLTEELAALTRHHFENCREYANMLRARGFDPYAPLSHYADLPFLPVRLFKDLSLKSAGDGEIFKTMTSSGTTGQAVSRIFLDRETASLQQRVLVKIMADFIGAKRLPMIIIDCPSVVNDRAMFSARGAGILGFSMFGSDRIYALGDDMRLNAAGLADFLEKHGGGPMLLFGFTFMVWQHFYSELRKAPGKFDLSNGVLVHGGGWKKLASQSVSPDEFKRRLRGACGLKSIHDYYGMVEQTGSIYVECERGHLHASIFSDAITRRALDLSPCGVGEPGIIEVVSALPRSYPGHALLTEDEGVILGEDGCPCGRLGKYFKVLGRLKNAELRGCSDTYAAGF